MKDIRPILESGRPPPGRDRAVDISRGIGIFLVVIGHVLIGLNGALGSDTSRNTWLTLIYTFHMALFFMLSGAYSRRSAIEPILEFASRALTNFIYPYILWSLILTGIAYLMRGHTNVSTDQLDLLKILYEPPAVMWFLYFLFIAFVVLRLTHEWTHRARLALAMTLVVGGYVLDIWVPGNVWYVGMFLLAAQFGLPSRKLLDDRRLFLASAVVMAVTAGLAWTQGSSHLEGIPGRHIFYIPATVAGVFLVMQAARMIDQGSRSTVLSRLISQTFDVLGRKTMPIFLTHILFTAGVRITLLKLGVDDPWTIGIAATVVGIAAPLCMALLAERLEISRYVGWPSPARSGSSSGHRTKAT